MKIAGTWHRTIWLDDDGWSVRIIDQTRLPYAFETLRLTSLTEAAHAIRSMQVRGAPLIGVAAAFGVCLALREGVPLDEACEVLHRTRPTAVNLAWALARMREALRNEPDLALAYRTAQRMADDDAAACRRIGEHGLPLLQAIHERTGKPVQVLTHCNAGWLATVDWGTALAPIYLAHEAGIPLHVWVDETRPRSQGFLTAWELGQHGVAHTVVADNAGGHLMQQGQVDLCLVGSDRTTRAGDVCNKIGTYLKALAAKDCGVPFHVALPSSTIDWTLERGVGVIPIEERDGREMRFLFGRSESGALTRVEVVPSDSPVANPAFDVTPARLVTSLVTERGVCSASREGLLRLFPERISCDTPESAAPSSTPRAG